MQALQGKSDGQPLLGVPGGYVLALLDVVGRWKIRPPDLLGDALSTEHLLQSGAAVDVETFAALFRRAMQLTGEPGLAVYVGLRMRATLHGFLGYAAMTAATMRDSLHLLERYSPIRMPLRFQLVEDAGEATLGMTLEASLAALHELVVVATFVGLGHMANELAGRKIAGRAEVTFPMPSWYRRLAHLLPGPAQFCASADRLIFPAAALDYPIATADPVAVQLASVQCERELVTLESHSSRVLAVQQYLPAAHGKGFRQLAEVAAAMRVSPRTLKRQLAGAGTSFSALLEHARRERAIELLFTRRRKLETIAFELGYADVASFARAFRRWTGSSPGRYRRPQPAASAELPPPPL